MDWPTAVSHLAQAIQYVGIAWAIAWAIVGFFKALTS